MFVPVCLLLSVCLCLIIIAGVDFRVGFTFGSICLYVFVCISVDFISSAMLLRCDFVCLSVFIFIFSFYHCVSLSPFLCLRFFFSTNR